MSICLDRAVEEPGTKVSRESQGSRKALASLFIFRPRLLPATPSQSPAPQPGSIFQVPWLGSWGPKNQGIKGYLAPAHAVSYNLALPLTRRRDIAASRNPRSW